MAKHSKTEPNPLDPNPPALPYSKAQLLAIRKAKALRELEDTDCNHVHEAIKHLARHVLQLGGKDWVDATREREVAFLAPYRARLEAIRENCMNKDTKVADWANLLRTLLNELRGANYFRPFHEDYYSRNRDTTWVEAVSSATKSTLFRRVNELRLEPHGDDAIKGYILGRILRENGLYFEPAAKESCC